MPKLLYLVTEDWFFVSHFLPMARTARGGRLRGRGGDARARPRGAASRRKAAACVALENERAQPRRCRGGARLLRASWRIVRAERPDIVHCIALRMVVLGGLAARLRRREMAGARADRARPCCGARTRSDRARRARRCRASSSGDGCRVRTRAICSKTPTIRREFGLDAGKSPVTIVPGAGVDPRRFSALARAAGAAAEGRRGGAHDRRRRASPKRSRRCGARVRSARRSSFDLYGAPDPSNRRSCTEADLRQWSAEPGIAWHGATRRRRGGLAHPSCRDAADLVSRGRAAQPDRGRGLRPSDRDHRRAGLPRSGARPARGYPGSAARQRGGGARSGRTVPATPTCGRGSARPPMRGSWSASPKPRCAARSASVYAGFGL